MSGEAAYRSFCNYVKTALADSGINVVIEKDGEKIPPYLVIQPGPELIKSKWLSSYMCQGWLTVENNGTEPLSTTMGRYKQVVLAATQDVGSLEKYDYSQSPAVVIGTYTPAISGPISGEMSNDPLRSKRVITWELHSNSK